MDKAIKTPDGPNDAQRGRRYTYLDCLRGTAPAPTSPNGSTLFQVLMVGGMVTFMVTINGLRNAGPSFLLQSHWLYPIVFCLAFLVRTFISSKMAGAVARRFVNGRLEGARKALAMTVVNVCCTAPIMCAIVTLLVSGADGFAWRYITTLPVTAPLAIAVNYLVVGPAAKLLFHNRISPAGGIGIMEELGYSATPLARLLGFE